MDFSSHNPLSSNSLSLAARNNDVANVRLLLQKINPNCVDNRGWTCLHEAANSDSYECLELILNHRGCRPLCKTHEGHTALYLACRNRCSLKTIKLLLDTAKMVNDSSTEGVTPLHVVSEQGRVELLQLLLDYKADITAQDFDGDTPLHEACLAKQPEAIKLLLSYGADPNIKNQQHFTPFHIACAGPCLGAVSNLVYYVDNVNQRTARGDTPLILALRSLNDYIIDFLLYNGANPNLKNNDDKLALDIAIDIGYSWAFKKLLSVTKKDVINVNIVSRACKPHNFTFEILRSLLASDLGPKYFEYTEPCQKFVAETVEELKPSYRTDAPLNVFLTIAEYLYTVSCEKFRECFNLFLKRGVSVNAAEASEFPPLAYIHHCNHVKCVHEVFGILVQHGCNVDYCSSPDIVPRITDAFLASLTLDPSTMPFMIPYSLYCDPGTIIEVAANNAILDRMPLLVQKKLLNMIDSEHEMTISEYRSCFVPSLKHITRLKVRDIIKLKDGTVKTTQQFIEIVHSLPIPQVVMEYLRFF